MRTRFEHGLGVVQANGMYGFEINRAVQSPVFVLILAVLLLTQTMVAGSVLAAELKGFGAVKFGMTKAEAWDAVGAEGRWERISPTNKGLSYDYPVEDDRENWTVFQTFRDGKAVGGYATYQSYDVSRQDCLTRGERVAEKIEAQHGVAPFVRKGTPFYDLSVLDIGRKDKYRILNLYNFTFDEGAFIFAMITAMSRRYCLFTIFFSEAIAEPIPF